MSRFLPSTEVLAHLRPSFVDQDSSIVPNISDESVYGSMRNVLPVVSAHLMNKLTLDILELPLPEYRIDSLGNDITLSRIKYLSYNLFSKNNWDNDYYKLLLSFTCKLYGVNILRDKEASVPLQEMAYFSLECIRSVLYHLINNNPNKPKHGFASNIRFHDWLNSLHSSLFNMVYTESEDGNREYYEDSYALKTYLDIYNNVFKEIDFIIHQECGLITNNPNHSEIAANYKVAASKMIEYFYHRGIDEIKFNNHDWNMKYADVYLEHRNSYVSYYSDLPFGIPTCPVNYTTPLYSLIGVNDLNFNKATSVLHSPNFNGGNFNEVKEDLENPYLKIKREYEQNMVNRENPIKFRSVSTPEDIIKLNIPDHEKVVLLNKLSDLETFGVDTTDPNYATDKDFFRNREPIMNTYRVNMMEDLENLPGLDFISTTEPDTDDDVIWEEITELLIDDSPTIKELNIKEIDMTDNSPDVIVDDREVLVEGGLVEPENSNWLKPATLNINCRPNSPFEGFGKGGSTDTSTNEPMSGMKAFLHRTANVDPSSLPKKTKVNLDLNKIKSEVIPEVIKEPVVEAKVSEDKVKFDWEDVVIENVKKHLLSKKKRFNNLILSAIKDEKSEVRLFINELVENLVIEKLSTPIMQADLALKSVSGKSKTAVIEELSIDVDTDDTTGGFFMSEAVDITDEDDIEFDNEPRRYKLNPEKYFKDQPEKNARLLGAKHNNSIESEPEQITEKKFDKILVGKDGVRLGHLELVKKTDFIPINSDGIKIDATGCVFATMYLGKMVRILYSTDPSDIGLQVDIEIDGQHYVDPRKILHLNDGFDSKLIPSLIPAKDNLGNAIPNSYVANGKFTLCNDLGYMYRRLKDGSLYLTPDKAVSEKDRFIYDYKTERFFVIDLKGHRPVETASIYNKIFGDTYNPALLPDGDYRKEIDYIPNTNFHQNVVNLHTFPKHVFKTAEVKQETVVQPVIRNNSGIIVNRSNTGLIDNTPKSFIVNNGSAPIVVNPAIIKENVRTVSKLSDLKILSVNLNDLKSDFVLRDPNDVSGIDCVRANRKKQKLVTDSGINLEYNTTNNVVAFKIDDPNNVIAIDVFNDCVTYDEVLNIMNDSHEKLSKRNDEYGVKNMTYVNILNSMLTDKTNQYLKLNISPGISIDDFREDFLDLFDHFKNHRSSFISENYERHIGGLVSYINAIIQINVQLTLQSIKLNGLGKHRCVYVPERFVYTDKSSSELSLNSLTPRGDYLENVNIHLYKDMVDIYGRLTVQTSIDSVVYFVTSDNVIYEIGVVDNVTVPFSSKNVKDFYIRKR